MLKNVLNLLISETVINETMFCHQNYDELLDLRDNNDFDSNWMKVFNELEKIKFQNSETELIDEIRKEAFMRTYQITKSGELSECVSDDFELISKACLAEYNNIWLNSLAASYMQSVFPCGQIKQTTLKLEEILL